MTKVLNSKRLAVSAALIFVTGLVTVGAASLPSHASTPCTTSGPTTSRTSAGTEIVVDVSCTAQQPVQIAIDVIGTGGNSIALAETSNTVAANTTSRQRVVTLLPIEQICVTVNGQHRCIPG